MLIAMPFLISTPVKAAPVNCEPWSVLKVAGLPCFASASCNASTQNAASIVIDTRDDKTRRLNHSSTTARYTKPSAIGIYVVVIAYTWHGLVIAEPPKRTG